MTEHYTRPKTVRFEHETWQQIEIAARKRDETTSQYIRNIVENHIEVS